MSHNTSPDRQKDFLVYDTLSDAQDALENINLNMGYPCENVISWATVTQRVTDSKYCVCKPPAEYMTGVSGYVTEQFEIDWFHDLGEHDANANIAGGE